MVSFIKKVYTIISIFSTLTIFSAIILFLIGKMGLETASDDDLIMRDIKQQIPQGLSITSVRLEDIHGFGNESIIVLADTGTITKGRTVANQILIFDKIENDILNQINHLFGYGSNYKLSYIFSLETGVCEDMDDEHAIRYSLDLLDVVELTGDTSKELIVSFMPLPTGSSGVYEIGILSYSFDKQSYYILGTYPTECEYSDQCAPFTKFQQIETIFHSKDSQMYNYYEPSKLFTLENRSGNNNDFFIRDEFGELYLVRTAMIWGDDESHIDPHKHIISVFRPVYIPDTDELEWDVCFSQETSSYIEYCTKEFVISFLNKNGMHDVIANYPK